jgi:predicted nucleotidyltransferase component of viral defense system
MISEQCFSREWIEEKTNGNLSQRETLEKVIHAFHLLELLSTQNLDFIFKGGSSLLLHFEEFHRFSIDIDILINDENYIKLVEYLSTFIDTRFIRVTEDIRRSRIIKKHHYKFIYRSNLLPNRNNDSYVLLDIVVADNPYQNSVEKEIKFGLLKCEPPIRVVQTPQIEALLGDKLTAFAPNTIGIRYVDLKYTEIIKQLYDCSRLYRVCNDFNLVYVTYIEISQREIRYRELTNVEVRDCIEDSLNTCKLILSDGQFGDSLNFEMLKRGIQGFSNFTVQSFGLHDAIVCAMDVYCCIIKLKCNGEDKFLNRLHGFQNELVQASFLNRNQIKRLKILSGPIFEDFLKAVWVENQFIKFND